MTEAEKDALQEAWRVRSMNHLIRAFRELQRECPDYGPAGNPAIHVGAVFGVCDLAVQLIVGGALPGHRDDGLAHADSVALAAAERIITGVAAATSEGQA